MVTVELSEPVWRELMVKKNPGESFDDVLRREFGLGGTGEKAQQGGTVVEVNRYDTLEFPSGTDRDECIDAIEAARAYLREQGKARQSEFVREIMPEHPVGYDVQAALDKLDSGDRYKGSWWRKVVKPGLEEADDVEKPAPGKSDWRWVG